MPEWAVYIFQADDICYIAFVEQYWDEEQGLLILTILMVNVILFANVRPENLLQIVPSVVPEVVP